VRRLARALLSDRYEIVDNLDILTVASYDELAARNGLPGAAPKESSES
jgi:hypothetical protein